MSVYDLGGARRSAASRNLRAFSSATPTERTESIELKCSLARWDAFLAASVRSPASVRAEAAAAQSQLRKATAYATSLSAARAVADEKARKLREAADRLAPPKSD